MKNKGSKKSKGGAAASFFKSLLIGLSASLGAFICLLLVFAGVCSLSKDPSALLTPLALASNYLAALVGGFFTHRANKSASFVLCGAACGTAFMLLMMLILFRFGGSERMSFILRFFDLPCAILGAFLSSLMKEKKRRRFGAF